MTPSTLRAATVAIVASAMSTTSAQQPGTERLDLQGTVGTYRIGASMQIREHTTFLSGYYFYASQLRNIPLTQPVQAKDQLEITGADGSHFHLHYTGNGSEHGAPLTFYNSLALDGTWTLGATTLPVHLGFSSSSPATGRRYADVTDRSDQAFETQVQSFVRSVLANDRDAATRFVAYPFRINSHPPLIIKTPAELKAHWTEIFTPDVLARLKQAIPHDMFVRNGEAMLGDGLLWFSSKGADSLNP